MFYSTAAEYRCQEAEHVKMVRSNTPKSTISVLLLLSLTNYFDKGFFNHRTFGI